MTPLIVSAVVAISANDDRYFRAALEALEVSRMPRGTAADYAAILERLQRTRAANREAFEAQRKRRDELNQKIEELNRRAEEFKKRGGQ